MWQKRYCCLVPHMFLYYYESDVADSPRGIIDLEYFTNLDIQNENVLKISTPSGVTSRYDNPLSLLSPHWGMTDHFFFKLMIHLWWVNGWLPCIVTVIWWSVMNVMPINNFKSSFLDKWISLPRWLRNTVLKKKDSFKKFRKDKRCSRIWSILWNLSFKFYQYVAIPSLLFSWT